jgi:hypothetical protein
MQRTIGSRLAGGRYAGGKPLHAKNPADEKTNTSF